MLFITKSLDTVTSLDELSIGDRKSLGLPSAFEVRLGCFKSQYKAYIKADPELQLAKRQALAVTGAVGIPYLSCLAFEIMQNKHGAEYLGALTSNTGNFNGGVLFTCLLGSFLSKVTCSQSNRMEQVAAGALATYITLGETILPKIMPAGSVADPKDIPAGLIGVIAGYFLSTFHKKLMNESKRAELEFLKALSKDQAEN